MARYRAAAKLRQAQAWAQGLEAWGKMLGATAEAGQRQDRDGGVLGNARHEVVRAAVAPEFDLFSREPRRRQRRGSAFLE